ncbi:hypothetical protein MTR_7g027165 [Medicago truncatula]|uniref:Uncharacterized protein n=1 Tax=Medicago truncatula TaxID=3880 RepID=A0A072TWY7_MEDTR|nr:hypothetical protein MTR_7g027165 [Medicago truncatula]
MEIKTKVIQLLLVNSFTEMDHEDPINHLTKLCKNAESLGASNSKDENLYLSQRLVFPQLRQIRTLWRTSSSNDSFLIVEFKMQRRQSLFLLKVLVRHYMKHGNSLNPCSANIQATGFMISLKSIILEQRKFLLDATGEVTRMS